MVLCFKNEVCAKNHLESDSAFLIVNETTGEAAIMLPPDKSLPFFSVSRNEMKSRIEGLTDVLVGLDAMNFMIAIHPSIKFSLSLAEYLEENE